MSAKPDPFYRAFEDRFRGSHETIRSRLETYRSVIEPLKRFSAEPRALDIGCGRGEWLELVGEIGFFGLGVDLDEGMLDAARARGLDVRHADALETMRHAEEGSYDIVSGFHIAEHLLFEDLRTVVREALRILRPGGLLILETPNPENIRVASTNFHLDPTHNHPLPPDLLSFVAEQQGFARVAILRLQEDAGLRQSQEASLLHVLGGVSPDYALVAQKQGADEIMEATRSAMGAKRGLKLEELAEKFENTYARTAAVTDAFQTVRHLVEQEVHRHIDIIERQQKHNDAQQEILQNLQDSNVRQQSILDKTLGELEAVRHRLAEVEAERSDFGRKNETMRLRLEREIEAYRTSSSWRLTRPLRMVGELLHRRS